MRKFIGNMIESTFSNQHEGFNSSYGGNFLTPPGSKNKAWVMILSFIIVELIILIFGKFLWNRVAIKIIPGLNPIVSILEILGLSILIKLLTN